MSTYISQHLNISYVLFIFKLIWRINILSISCEISLIRIPQGPTGYHSTLVQLMSWCRQAQGHYPNYSLNLFYRNQSIKYNTVSFSVIEMDEVQRGKASNRDIIHQKRRIYWTTGKNRVQWHFRWVLIAARIWKWYRLHGIIIHR